LLVDVRAVVEVGSTVVVVLCDDVVARNEEVVESQLAAATVSMAAMRLTATRLRDGIAIDS
jgi:hypothetical protein